MLWAAYVALGLVVGLSVRMAAPGWRGATFAEGAAMVAVAVVGSVVAAMTASALPIATSFLAFEPVVVSSGLAGAIGSIIALGSPTRTLARGIEERA